MSGLIGGVVRRQLEGRYDLVALNRHRPVEGVNSHIADIADLDAILPAFEGVHTVIHLAAESVEDSTWQAYRDSNLTGTYNVFEASRMSRRQEGHLREQRLGDKGLRADSSIRCHSRWQVRRGPGNLGDGYPSVGATTEHDLWVYEALG